MPEHQKAQKRSQKCKAFRIKEEPCKKRKCCSQRGEMRRIREEIDRIEERFRQFSDKVDKNKMADAETAAELQGVAGRIRKKRQQRFPSGGLLNGDDGGTVFRFGSGSGEV